MTKLELESIIASPIKILANSDFVDEQLFMLDNTIVEELTKHNERFHRKIERIEIISVYGTEDSNLLDLETYEVFLGDEMVLSGKVLDSFNLPKFVAFVLDSYHNEIIEKQNENEEKLKILDKEKYYEALYMYYRLRYNKNAFYYLKQLAQQYPNSSYNRELNRAYRFGEEWLCKKNLAIYKKTRVSYKEKNFHRF